MLEKTLKTKINKQILNLQYNEGFGFENHIKMQLNSIF